MLKKTGTVVVGVAAGLLAAAPAASATEGHDEGGKSPSSSNETEQCTNEVGIGGVETGDNELGIGQIANGNNLNGNQTNILSCNDVEILNNSLNDNFSGNASGNMSGNTTQNEESGPGSAG